LAGRQNYKVKGGPGWGDEGVMRILKVKGVWQKPSSPRGSQDIRWGGGEKKRFAKT